MKDGWLYKLSGFMFRSWQYRWITIENSQLRYYITKASLPRQILGNNDVLETFQ